MGRLRDWLRHIQLNWGERIDLWRDYPLPEGTMLSSDRYRVEQFIAMGSYGLAYRVYDLAQSQVVLLKQNRPSKGELGRKLLVREAGYMRTLNHPRIPKVLDEFAERHHQYLVMTYISGHNMEELLFEQNRTFTELEAVEFVGEIAILIKEVHDAGLVHRDVRIPNVLLNTAGVHLIDFGLARRLDDKLDDVEQLLNAKQELQNPFKERIKVVERSSDWFALGHFLLFLLYSNYTEEEMVVERSWEEELTLHPATVELLKHLLEAVGEDESIISLLEHTRERLCLT